MFKAVELTKSLRNKSEDLNDRINLAVNVLNGTQKTLLPRKESVILEWVFDTLAIEPQSCSSSGIWELLSQVWLESPSSSQLRVFKNHKFVTCLAKCLESSECLDAAVKACSAISSSIDLFLFATDQQISVLACAYLGNTGAQSHPISSLLFKFFSSRSAIFIGKLNADVPQNILNLPSDDERKFFLKEYLREDRPVNISLTVNLEDLVNAIAESRLKSEFKLLEILSTNQQLAVPALNAMNTTNQITVNFVAQILQIWQQNKDWEIINACLSINPAFVFESSDFISLLVNSNPPPLILAKLLESAASLRQLVFLLSVWQPEPKIALNLSVKLGAMHACETLSPLQVTELIDLRPQSLSLLFQSLSYEVANSDLVVQKFKQVVNSLDNELKLAVLSVCPQIAEFVEPTSSELVIRKLEISSFGKLDSKLLKEDSLDLDRLVLRYFPTLNSSLKESKLRKLLNKCSSTTRSLLANNFNALELDLLRSVLIDLLIENREFLSIQQSLITKQMFSWEQRHKLVELVIEDKFNFSASLAADLVDSEHLPSADKVLNYISSCEPKDTQVMLKLVKPCLKNNEHAMKLLNGSKDWKHHLLNAVITQSPESLEWANQNCVNSDLSEPVLYIIQEFPNSNQHVLQKLALQTIDHMPSTLYELICQNNYPWQQITALFLASNSVFTQPFANYISKLSERAQYMLVMQAIDERKYTVLECMLSHQLAPEILHQKLNVVVAQYILSPPISESPEFWSLIECTLKSKLNPLNQFTIELLLDYTTNSDVDWDTKQLVLSRVLVLKRKSLRFRLHLCVAHLSALISGISSLQDAKKFTRLIDNLCNPAITSNFNDMTPRLAKERRIVVKHAGPLLHNLVYELLRFTTNNKFNSETTHELRQALFPLVDLIGTEGLKTVTSGMDGATRAYLRTIFEEYKVFRYQSD